MSHEASAYIPMSLRAKFATLRHTIGQHDLSDPRRTSERLSVSQCISLLLCLEECAEGIETSLGSIGLSLPDRYDERTYQPEE